VFGLNRWEWFEYRGQFGYLRRASLASAIFARDAAIFGFDRLLPPLRPIFARYFATASSMTAVYTTSSTQCKSYLIRNVGLRKAD
jgi:hypothetical protein